MAVTMPRGCEDAVGQHGDEVKHARRDRRGGLAQGQDQEGRRRDSAGGRDRAQRTGPRHGEQQPLRAARAAEIDIRRLHGRVLTLTLCRHAPEPAAHFGSAGGNAQRG